jgi:hypothetical protein
MEEGYAIRYQTLPHFITGTVVDWIGVFSRKIYRDGIITSLIYCTKIKSTFINNFVKLGI